MIAISLILYGSVHRTSAKRRKFFDGKINDIIFFHVQKLVAWQEDAHLACDVTGKHGSETPDPC